MGSRVFDAGQQALLAPSRRWDGLSVGLYGGSFNPAHAGHVHVSQRAIKHLQLDALWWLVSPQNPLKHSADMAPFHKRCESAQSIVKSRKIYISGAEKHFATQYSADTIARLQQRFKRTRFIWVIGADNLASFHHWRDWHQIFTRLPIAVIDRPGYSLPAFSSLAAQRYRASRLPARQAPLLKRVKAPAWTYLTGPLHPASATRIRTQQPDWAGKADDA
jgi:nicotinate-nucleotide adenylyltransferase